MASKKVLFCALNKMVLSLYTCIIQPKKLALFSCTNLDHKDMYITFSSRKQKEKQEIKREVKNKN